MNAARAFFITWLVMLLAYSGIKHAAGKREDNKNLIHRDGHLLMQKSHNAVQKLAIGKAGENRGRAKKGPRWKSKSQTSKSVPLHNAGTIPKRRRRYITYNRYVGQYNNQITSLQMAICFARMYNRTVVFQGFTDGPRRPDKYEDYTIPLSTYIDVKRIQRNKIPLVEWTAFIKEVKSLSSLQRDTFALQPKKISSPDKYATILQEAQKSLQSSVALVELPFIFHWRIFGKKRCREEDTNFFFKYVIPRRGIRKVADRFIKAYLTQPYAAIHYRTLDGKCRQSIENIIDNILKDFSKRQVKSVFLATDGADPLGAELLKSRFNAISIDKEMDGLYNAGIVDMYIISKASVLYTNPWSTLATNAILYNRYFHNLNSSVVRYTQRLNGKVLC